MHKKVVAGACFVAASLFLVVALGAGLPGDPGSQFPPKGRLARGHAITPVPLAVNMGNVHAVMRGSYIVNAVGGCNDCHTCPSFAAGHNPYDGGDGEVNAQNFLAGGVNFGVAVSANLTPDDDGLPAGLTREQFLSAIKTGRDPHDGHVLQVMPWPVHRNMIDADLNAIYSYLAAIPKAEPGSCSAPGQ